MELSSDVFSKDILAVNVVIDLNKAPSIRVYCFGDLLIEYDLIVISTGPLFPM